MVNWNISSKHQFELPLPFKNSMKLNVKLQSNHFFQPSMILIVCSGAQRGCCPNLKLSYRTTNMYISYFLLVCFTQHWSCLIRPKHLLYFNHFPVEYFTEGNLPNSAIHFYMIKIFERKLMVNMKISFYRNNQIKGWPQI